VARLLGSVRLKNIAGHELSFTDSALKKLGIGFNPKPDGSFDQTNNADGYATTISINGSETRDTIDEYVTNYSSKRTNHWDLANTKIRISGILFELTADQERDIYGVVGNRTCCRTDYPWDHMVWRLV
jgi:hypothetical protein